MCMPLLLLLLITLSSCTSESNGTILTDANFELQTGIHIHHYRQFRDHFSPIKNNWLIMYQSPWCLECKHVLPAWHELAQSNPNLKLGTVNCVQNRKSCYDVFVDEYPTIILFKEEGKAYKYRFSGIRNDTGFQDFVKGGYKSEQPFVFYAPSALERAVTYITTLGIVGLAVFSTVFATILYTCFTFLFSQRRPRKPQERSQPAFQSPSVSATSIASDLSPTRKRD